MPQVGRTALVAVPSETRCWLQRPQTEAKSYTYKGEARAKRVVVGPPGQRPEHSGGGGGEPPRLTLVSPEGLRRNQGADRVYVCPSTGDPV